MNYNKKTIRDVDVAGKKILLRCDFNVPRDKETGAITSDKRIVAALPTIRYLLEKKAAVIVGHAEVLRQARRLLAEHQPAVRGEPGLGVVPGRFGGGQPHILRRLGIAAEKIVQPVVVVHVHQMPVVQPSPLDGTVRDVEAQGADQVKAAAGGGAGAGDVAAILGYFRFYQHDMQHTRPNSFSRYLPIVMQ